MVPAFWYSVFASSYDFFTSNWSALAMEALYESSLALSSARSDSISASLSLGYCSNGLTVAGLVYSTLARSNDFSSKSLSACERIDLYWSSMDFCFAASAMALSISEILSFVYGSPGFILAALRYSVLARSYDLSPNSLSAFSMDALYWSSSDFRSANILSISAIFVLGYCSPGFSVPAFVYSP